MCKICNNQATRSQKLFAWIYSKSDNSLHKLYSEHKKRLFKDLQGNVLEIGPGTGINFDYFPANIEYFGLEPNEAMQKYLIEKAREKGVNANISTGVAENLPYEDNSMDVVISTLVLCSVTSQLVVAQEIRRVLKPGGRFIFIEHVGAPKGSTTRKLQEYLKPLSKFIADGCDHARDTAEVIENSGFSKIDIENFETPGPLGYKIPHINGVAFN
ncbi:MAG: methyltransferase domain-containing protein [Fulvivirga sp.]|uniref:class I SAM-dependent methyltransferase n=1 Tax=Fulvivirga sp. TaxID=1931237 RepID=UPI0032EC85AF